MRNSRPSYEHRQTAVFMRVTFALSLAVVLPLYAIDPAAGNAFLMVAPLLLLVFLAFDGLTIRIVDGELRWTFGRLGFPRWRLNLAEIVEATATRTTFWEGWGIRITRRGWLYSVSGFDAVQLRRTDGKSFLLGTDEPRKLVSAIERAKMSA
jgi:hypothetical protein